MQPTMCWIVKSMAPPAAGAQPKVSIFTKQYRRGTGVRDARGTAQPEATIKKNNEQNEKEGLEVIGGKDLVRHALAMGDPLRFESKWVYRQFNSLPTLLMPSTSLEPMLPSWAYWTRLDIIIAFTTGDPSANNMLGTKGFHNEWAFFETPGLREPPWDTQPRFGTLWPSERHAAISTAILPSVWLNWPKILRCCTLAWKSAWELTMAVMKDDPLLHHEDEPAIANSLLLQRLDQLRTVAIQELSGISDSNWTYPVDTRGIVCPTECGAYPKMRAETAKRQKCEQKCGSGRFE